MQKINMNTLKRDCLMAVLIPTIFFGALVLLSTAISAYALIPLLLAGAGAIGWGLNQYFQHLEKSTWQQQMRTVIEKVSVPAIIADKKHNVIITNTSFNHSVLATLVDQQPYLPALLAAQAPSSNEIESNKKTASLHAMMESLCAKVKTQISWKEEQFDWIMTPLYSSDKQRLGTLIESKLKIDIHSMALPVIQQPAKTETVVKDPIENEAFFQTTHPIMILNIENKIQQVNKAMMSLLIRDEEDLSELKHKWLSVNFLSVAQALAPKLVNRIAQALEEPVKTIFVAEHDSKIYDWIITPIELNLEVLGYVVEVIYPSRQEHRGYEESLVRMHEKRLDLEKELMQFTRGIAKLNLYQKEAEQVMEYFNPDEYEHPLLKKSSKIVQQLGNSLPRLHDEIHTLKNALKSDPVVSQQAAKFSSLFEISTLTSTINKNVEEVQFEFSEIYQEFIKLKSFMKDQKNANQIFSKPVSLAMRATEQAIVQTIGYAEEVTMVLQELHESHRYLDLLKQESMDELSSVKCAETVEQVMANAKHRLGNMLTDFDKLKDRWVHASEQLKEGLQISKNAGQEIEHFQTLHQNAHEHYHHVSERLQNISELTDKIKFKAGGSEVTQAPVANRRSLEQFDQVVFSVEDNKKKAEDVLLEGLGK